MIRHNVSCTLPINISSFIRHVTMISVTTIESTTSSSKSLSSTLDSKLKDSSTRLSSIFFGKNSVSNEVTVPGPDYSPITSDQPNQLSNNIESDVECYYIETSDLSTNFCSSNVALLNAFIRDYNDKIYTQALSSIYFNELDLRHKESQNMIDSVQNQTTACSDDNARALKLAVELTMININKSQMSNSPSLGVIQDRLEQIKPNSLLTTACSPESPYQTTSKKYLQTNHHPIQTKVSLINQNTNKVYNFEINDASRNNSIDDIDQTMGNSVFIEDRLKKSQNMTECVPVPSSEHVAEIVGRQGCKIKALRAKTNTYIKTPVRNEEPVFVVTGRKEDVSKAKLEILSAAEHFTIIRATRRLNDTSANANISGNKQHPLGLTNTLPSSSHFQGQVTIQVRVPYRLVGLVVGTKGNTIKHIQQETQTYIVTPSRDKEPIFEVTGLADNVELARKHIEIHLATRIGNSQNNSITTSVSSPSPSHCATVRQSTDGDSAESSLQSLNALNQILNDDLHSEILTSIYKNGICSTLDNSHIGCSITYPEDKCNNMNSLNGYHGDINVTMINNERKEKYDSYSLAEHVNNQIKCTDFINNLMDSNMQQLSTDQSSTFT